MVLVARTPGVVVLVLYVDPDTTGLGPPGSVRDHDLQEILVLLLPTAAGLPGISKGNNSKGKEKKKNRSEKI